MKLPYVSLSIIAALFVLVSYLVQTNMGFFEVMIGDSVLGMLAYVLIAIIGTVVAPVTALPLMPIAVSLWGPNVSALLSAVGWLIGSGIDYEIARRFGKKLVKKIVKIETIEKFSTEIPDRYSFMGLVLLRLTLPVDLLSYALGLFTLVGRKAYYLSTAIGILPFAFIWAYLGALHYGYQAVGFLLVGIVLYIGFKMRGRLFGSRSKNQ